MSYRTVAKSVELEEVVKGSRFIASVTRSDTPAEVLGILARVRLLHPGASHHAWAYRIDAAYRFSDDGEPAGTAGRPMLEVLERCDLDHVLAVVTRYFGGTKLGAGSLARAYGGTLARALDKAEVIEVKARAKLGIAVDFSAMDALHRLLDGWPELAKGDMRYTPQGLELEIETNAEDLESLKEKLVEITRASVRFL